MTKEVFLYRYLHPFFSESWIYVGQTTNPDYRDSSHRRGTRAFGHRFNERFPGTPLPKPEIFGNSFSTKANADWAEIEAMFRFHTWHGYPGGMNLTLPGSQDYTNIGRIGGLSVSTEAAILRGKKGNKGLSREDKVKGGRMGARNQPLEARSRGGKNQPWETKVRIGRIGGLLGGPIGGKITACLRWNVNRGKPCTCGKHVTP